MPKIHMVDTGVGSWLLDVTMDSVQRRLPSTLTELGHRVETFAVNELLKQVSWLDDVRAGHYRTNDGHEIDLVLGGVGLIAWRRARATGEVYADLAEATYDVHLAELVNRFCHAEGLRPISLQRGKELTERFRKAT